MKPKVLVVDDDQSMCEMLELSLAQEGFSVSWRRTAAAAFEAMAGEEFAAVVTDLRLGGTDGNQFCRSVVAEHVDVPVIVITAFGSLDTAIEAIRAGAYDFLTKPFEVSELALALERALEHRRLRQEVRGLRRSVSQSEHFDELIGESPVMKKLYGLLGRVAETNATVLITGETGTGKEMVARGLHRQSHRAKGPFVAIDCAAMPPHLLESELFGHKKGAFTGAGERQDGLFVLAGGGTIFLDEIGELPMDLQPKLLRALQERRVRPIGGRSEVQIDARIIAATNRDLVASVEAGQFREDLLFRLNVIEIEVPPLRARGQDVLLLADSFLRMFSKEAGVEVPRLGEGVSKLLLEYDWPGNVRELHNCMERAVALSRGGVVALEDLPERVAKDSLRRRDFPPLDESGLRSMAEIEEWYVLHVLREVGGNKARAARVLGFDRRTLYRKLELYGALDSGDDSDE